MAGTRIFKNSDGVILGHDAVPSGKNLPVALNLSVFHR